MIDEDTPIVVPRGRRQIVEVDEPLPDGGRRLGSYAIDYDEHGRELSRSELVWHVTARLEDPIEDSLEAARGLLYGAFAGLVLWGLGWGVGWLVAYWQSS